MDKIIEYTVVINGKPEGPYLLEQLKTLPIQSGTFIRKPGMDDYKEAHELPELRELLGFVKEVPTPQYFASFDQRLLAAAIDYFFLTCAYAVLTLLSFVVVDDKAERIMLTFSGLPLIPFAKFLYGSFAEASPKQGTIGKMLLNIKVTDLGGNRITLGNSFGRNSAKLFSVLTMFIGYLYSFLNKKQQCLHDLIANTLVIKDRLI
ncbi:RDD family protein [Pedobacter nyackensis]|uniref:RDD family protein n=1 Tax=Pedobacter nyackensis TaxID=475255 RepID=UPI00292D461C|nr:RDD family protein [Pedobacter nyackensis]